jgi:cellulose synthase/poly-beta-1,6-N-acetylglucosamine synthase-like glycosyltransferase
MTRIYLVVIALLCTLVTNAQVSKLVTGKMIDQKTEEPIEEIELKLINKDTKAEFLTETDDEGVFSFKNIPLGKYEFHVTDKDYMDNTFPIELKEEHSDNFTFGTPITASLKVAWMFNWGDRTIKNAKGETIVKEHYWSHLTGKIILTIYGLCLLLVFFYSVLQFSLAINYSRSKKGKYLYNAFSLTGRINRRDYILSLFKFSIFTTLLLYVENILGLDFENPMNSITTNAPLFVMSCCLHLILSYYIIAQLVKRAHDIDNSGWYILTPFYSIYLIFAKGKMSDNEFGKSIYTFVDKSTPVYDPAATPMVTVQLPMFNELYVAERIIETIANFDYPHDKLQIQVLDDSTDETKDVIAKKVEEVASRGINIQHIHRVDRTGYKAGALDAAMDRVQGEFIAIFDADFIPDPDFLQKTMPYFRDEKIGVVQTRWGHINKTYSILTELQAFGLNGHFAIEQGGRNSAGHFINFNGTGGVWRKQCIEEAGGWEHDTLTEDLDLSYRAQIKGWKFKYLEDVVAPAELPITMSALKSQQHRWMKGGAECFVKMWKTLLTAKGVKLSDRIHGLSHLFNSTVFVFILTISILSLFVLQIKDSFSDLNYILQYMGVFIISTVFLMFYYWHAFRDKTENTLGSFFRFVGRFFQFLVVSMGLSLSNTVAVLEGYLGIKSSFVRTPKFNVAVKSEFKGNKYDKKSLSIINIAEGILMITFGFTAVNRGLYGDLGMMPFHLMLAIGYGVIFFSTLKEIRTGQ